MSEHAEQDNPVVGISVLTNIGGTPHIRHAGPGELPDPTARVERLHPGETLVVYHHGVRHAAASPAPEPDASNTVTLVDHVGAHPGAGLDAASHGSLLALGEPDRTDT